VEEGRSLRRPAGVSLFVGGDEMAFGSCGGLEHGHAGPGWEFFFCVSVSVSFFSAGFFLTVVSASY
jgi:hypothetical protein